MKIIDDKSFETEVLKSEIPVIVDFFAEWCGPCRQMLPIFEEISNNNTKVKIVKINIDDSPVVASNFDVQTIPTFIVFKDGSEVERKIGAMNKSKAMEWVNSIG